MVSVHYLLSLLGPNYQDKTGAARLLWGQKKKSAAGSFLIKRNLDGSASSRKRRHFGRLSKFFANIVAPSPLTNDFDDYGDKLNKEVFVGREKNVRENEFWRVLRRGRNILRPSFGSSAQRYKTF